MMPTARYMQAIMVTEMGLLIAFMAASPTRRRWVPSPEHAPAKLPPPPAAPGLFRHNPLYLDANHFRIRTPPRRARGPHTPAISIPAPGGSAVSGGSSPHSRGSPPSAVPSLPSLPEYRPANPPRASAEPLLCCLSAPHRAAFAGLSRIASWPH